MSSVEVKRNFYGYKIYLNGLLHLYLPTPDTVVIESWVDAHASRYYIEYTLKDRKVLTEYQAIDTWKDILTQLEAMLP